MGRKKGKDTKGENKLMEIEKVNKEQQVKNRGGKMRQKRRQMAWRKERTSHLGKELYFLCAS